MKAISKSIPFPISLSDREGYIIGSTDSSRIGTLHVPSKEVLNKGSFIAFDEEQAGQLDNVLPGVAVPLNFGYETEGVLGIIGPPDEVKPYAQLIKDYVEMMWQETFHQEIAELETKTLETFLQYILLNERTDQSMVEQYCEALKLNYTDNYFCIVIDIGGSLIKNYEAYQKSFERHSLKENILNATAKVFEKKDNDICAFLNLEKVILVKSVETKTDYFNEMQNFQENGRLLIKMLHSLQVDNTLIASGSLCHSLHHIDESFAEAEYLIKYGKKENMSPKVYNYHNWDILLRLLPKKIDENLKEKMRDRLKPLIEEKGFLELKRNFLAYCDNNMNISEAAKQLYVHRNTLIYRLRKIEKITSLKTRNFQHCILLYIALKTLDHVPA